MSWVSRLRKLEPFVVETYLTACSFWAFHALITPPSNFKAFPDSFRLVATLEKDEAIWGLIALTAAIMKTMGLLLLLIQSKGLTTRTRSFSILLRCVGLGLSGFFWTLMGLSTLTGNVDSLFGFPGLLMGFLAWWILIRFPLSPGEQLSWP